MSLSGPIAWNDLHDQDRLPFRRRGVPNTARRRRAAARKRLRAEARKEALGRTCAYHEDLVALYDDGNGAHIGYLCRACTTIFTRTGEVSTPTLPRRPKVPLGEQRPSKAHAARVRAVDHLGVAYDARRAA